MTGSNWCKVNKCVACNCSCKTTEDHTCSTCKTCKPEDNHTPKQT